MMVVDEIDIKLNYSNLGIFCTLEQFRRIPWNFINKQYIHFQLQLISEKL